MNPLSIRTKKRVLRLFALMLVLGSFPNTLVWAHAGCPNGEPLVTSHALIDSPIETPAVIGEWRLPISSQDPDVLTQARVRAELVGGLDGRGTFLLLNFSFPDPQPWGIPFTFDRVQFAWDSEGFHHSTQIDWSENCTKPGRSMFPNDSWFVVVELSNSTEKLVLERPVFRVWGSRN